MALSAGLLIQNEFTLQKISRQHAQDEDEDEDEDTREMNGSCGENEITVIT